VIPKPAADALVALSIFGSVFAAGWMVGGMIDEPAPERYAPAVIHKDGSVTIERKPDAKPKLPSPTVPKGGRLVRTVEVTVKPVQPECDPVSVRLDMTSHDDGLRVSAVAAGGQILDAVDIPQDTIYRPRDTKHVVALERIGNATVIRYGRSLGSFDLGPSVSLESGRAQVGGWVAYRF